jgi:2-dehydro-3-deoxygluconokinase
MAELSFDNEQNIALGFAGDVYNSIIYAKSIFPQISCALACRVGKDKFSSLLKSHMQNHQIEQDLVQEDNSRNLGIYAINLDINGERSFDYWRDQSACSQLFSDDCKLQQIFSSSLLSKNTTIFISGITLGILKDEQKQSLLDYLAVLVQNGYKVAFDPNYRPKLWNNSEHARTFFEKAYQCANIILPGIDDQYSVFEQAKLQDCIDYFSQFPEKEIILKAGTDGMYGLINGKVQHHENFQPASIQVDSTAAGDSFAGIYLASRLLGKSIKTSMASANAVAREVVQHKGAIAPQTVLTKLKQHVNKEVAL